MAKTFCVVTGSRADYGLLYWLMKDIQSDAACKLQVFVTGMHLAPEFGLTYQVIEADGFTIDERVETVLSSDTPEGAAKSIALGVIGSTNAMGRLKPDILIALGDRTEIFASVQAALMCRVPVAHIGGGDLTEGAYDESIRHSITKMSHLHFATNAESAARICQMGEDPRHVYNVGSPGIDYIRRLKLLSREELESALGQKLRPRNLLITFHPTTLSATPAVEEFRQLLEALDNVGDDVGLIFTLANSDQGGRELIRITQEFVSTKTNASSFASLGQLRYLSLMAQVDAVVGNSSSGLYEAPSMQKPTVNIGDRQKGRLQPTSVINCPARKSEIQAAIAQALKNDCSGTVNPYGDGGSSRRILSVLKNIQAPESLLMKPFFTQEGKAQ